MSQRRLFPEMQRLLTEPEPKKKRKQYDAVSLLEAYKAVNEDGLSIYRAARNYGVPESTLRDRFLGIVQPEDCTPGPKRIFSEEEENSLSEHIKYMAAIGYGYSKQEVLNLATNLAIYQGKRKQDDQPLSSMWFYSFIKKHNDLHLLKPRKLTISRAQCASEEKIKAYYKELATIITKNDLQDKPNFIYNVDETGVSTEHNPPKIVGLKNTAIQSVTSPRTNNITIIGAGNAAGNYIPPYYIFPGKRWNDEYMNGAPPGSRGQCTETGWSNMQSFHNYLDNHFLKFVNRVDPKQPLLLLYDGHKSHVSLFLTEWAKKNNVILFVLPPHTSHLLQPLDVGIFGPFKTLYSKQCQKYMREHPGAKVTKLQIADLTRNPYLSAFSPQNLISAFRKTGVHPCQNTITTLQVAPASVYENEIAGTKDKPQDETNLAALDELDTLTLEIENNQSETLFQESVVDVEFGTKSMNQSDVIESDSNNINVTPCPTTSETTTDQKTLANFFSTRKITTIGKKTEGKKKKSSIVGNLSKKFNQHLLETQKKTTKGKKKFQTPWTKKMDNTGNLKSCVTTNTSNVSNKAQGKKTVKKGKQILSVSQNPSTSGTSKIGGSILLESGTETEDEDQVEYQDEEKCCVCKRFEPKELKDCVDFIITKWARCDVCQHWVHLIFCTSVRVIRLGAEFKCPCCC